MGDNDIRKIAFVSPRYVEASAGGAEVACRLFAENLRARKGIKTEILTTCAEDHFTWKNVHKEGAFEKNGVTIRRFKTDKRENEPEFLNISNKLSQKIPISRDEEEIFFKNNLNSSDLYDYLEKNKDSYDFVVFLPYLFGLSIYGSRICRDNGLILPCLHNEPYAKLDMVREMLRNAKGIICNSPPEAELVKDISGAERERIEVVGIGVSPQEKLADEKELEKYNINKPYIYYCGRREMGKNFFLLLEMFREYARHNRGKLMFVASGSGSFDILPSERDIIVDTSFVSEEMKALLYKKALLTCQPSTKESFSIAIMESWHQKRPVMVNKRADVTSYWVEISGGGFLFGDFYEFEQILNFSLENSDVLEKMGECGNYFVKKNFSWERITDRMFKALIKFKKML